jgi:hypothetical protein
MTQPEHNEVPLLHSQLRWLVRLRWAAGLAVVVLAGC